jgi:hypothetical protein
MVFQVEVMVFSLYNTSTAIEIVVKLELNHGSQLALFSAYVMPMRLFLFILSLPFCYVIITRVLDRTYRTQKK